MFGKSCASERASDVRFAATLPRPPWLLFPMALWGVDHVPCQGTPGSFGEGSTWRSVGLSLSFWNGTEARHVSFPIQVGTLILVRCFQRRLGTDTQYLFLLPMV